MKRQGKDVVLNIPQKIFDDLARYHRLSKEKVYQQFLDDGFIEFDKGTVPVIVEP